MHMLRNVGKEIKLPFLHVIIFPLPVTEFFTFKKVQTIFHIILAAHLSKCVRLNFERYD